MFFLRLNQITKNAVLKIADITDEQERIRLADFGFIKKENELKNTKIWE